MFFNGKAAYFLMKHSAFLYVLSCWLNPIVNGSCLNYDDYIPEWSELKTTWRVYSPVPKSVNEAVQQGWVLDSDCSKGLGNRYVKQNDTMILIFGANGAIAGVSVVVPKNLPFNFPSKNIQPYFVDEVDHFTLNAYFFDPNTICSNQNKSYPYIGDRLVLKGDKLERRMPTTTAALEKEGFWTIEKCLPSMGLHYYADIAGPLTANTIADNFFPFALLFNKNGQLSGFIWRFNADLVSPRFEKPFAMVLPFIFIKTPLFFYDFTKAPAFSTSQHFYFDSSPQSIVC